VIARRRGIEPLAALSTTKFTKTPAPPDTKITKRRSARLPPQAAAVDVRRRSHITEETMW